MIETTTNKLTYVVESNPVFAFPIPFFKQSDVHCYLYSNGTETELLRGPDFTVENKSDYSSGANIILNNLLPGSKLVIIREVELTQDVNLPEYGKLPTTALEAQLDKFIMICQQLKEITSRSFAVPHGMSDYDNEEIYGSFRTLVDNAETWANEAQSGASIATKSANKANNSASQSEQFAEAAAESSLRASSFAGSAAGAASSAVSAATEIRNIAEQASLNRVTLNFGVWGAEGILISYDDWTPVESIVSVAGQIEEHNSSEESHADLRESMGNLGNQFDLFAQSYAEDIAKKVDEHNGNEIAHSDIRNLIANNFKSTEIQKLAHTRCWISPLVTPARGTRSIVIHNLKLSENEIARALVEVRLKCIEENNNNGYKVGDYAQWGVRNASYYSPVQPLLTANDISCVTGSGETGICLVHKNTGSAVGAVLKQWAYEFRIWY